MYASAYYEFFFIISGYFFPSSSSLFLVTSCPSFLKSHPTPILFRFISFISQVIWAPIWWRACGDY